MEVPGTLLYNISLLYIHIYSLYIHIFIVIGGTWPPPGCRPLARFDQLGSTRALSWGRSSCCSCRRRRRGRPPPQWLVDLVLVLEDLRPPPPSRQAGIQRSRPPPGSKLPNEMKYIFHHPNNNEILHSNVPSTWLCKCFNLFVSNQYCNKHRQRHHHSDFSNGTVRFFQWSSLFPKQSPRWKREGCCYHYFLQWQGPP